MESWLFSLTYAVVWYIVLLRRINLWLAVSVMTKLLAGQSGVRILTGKEFFSSPCPRGKAEVVSSWPYATNTKVKNERRYAWTHLMWLHGVDRYKFTSTFYRISEAQFTLSLPYAEAQYTLSLPYAEAQYRIFLWEIRAWLISNVYLSLLSLVEMFAVREPHMWRL